MSYTQYIYICLKCGKRYPGSEAQSFRLQCDDCGDQALLEAEYIEKSPHFDLENPSFFRYRDWLPVSHNFSQAALPVLRQSKAIAQKWGLQDLDILFSGYSSQSAIRSTTFKEFEAYSVLSYIRRHTSPDQIMVVASAGNTARAFAEVALRENLAILLVVPDTALETMEFSLPITEDSKVVFISSTNRYDQKPSEYADAIAIAKILSDSPNFFPEGGVKNIARRDGLGIGYLHAQYMRWHEKPKSQPYRYYFQAIGSGTGAIGSYSMYRRLKNWGKIPNGHQLSLMLAQNKPFVPVAEHWHAGYTKFQPYAPLDSAKRNSQIMAPVLANRNPPYSVAGGLAGLLRQSGGSVFAVENHEIIQMQELFAHEEGLDILPAAAVAAAALQQAIHLKQIKPTEPILLHLTGGGQSQLERDFPQRYKAKAAFNVDWSDVAHSKQQQKQLIHSVEKLFGI